MGCANYNTKIYRTKKENVITNINCLIPYFAFNKKKTKKFSIYHFVASTLFSRKNYNKKYCSDKSTG